MIDRHNSDAAAAVTSTNNGTPVVARGWSLLDLPFSKINSILLLLIIYIAFCDTFLKHIQVMLIFYVFTRIITCNHI
jgi:hypothetical protein